MQHFSINYRSYALDLWGFGDTARNDDYSLASQTDLLNRFIGQMGIGRVVLIGHGIGSLVASNFAENFPDLVHRVVLMGFPIQKENLSARLDSETNEMINDWVRPGGADFDFLMEESMKTDNQAVQQLFREINDEKIRSMVSGLQMPGIYVYGKNDLLISPPSEKETELLPENSSVFILEESGAFPMLDNAEKVHRLILEFLTLPEGESPKSLQIKQTWKRRVR
jgi:pimeloyl-ACP methyl ester carboxylesterase